MRAGLKLLLESHTGFKVVSEASDGNQAVENALRTRPEVVVLDIAMPKLSGIEAAQRISAQLPNGNHHSEYAFRRGVCPPRAEIRRERLPAERFCRERSHPGNQSRERRQGVL